MTDLEYFEERYGDDPCLFAEEWLGVNCTPFPDDLPPEGYDKNDLPLWSKQVEILEALWKYKKVAVKSAHGIGKTFDAALAALCLFYIKRALGITTAPTFRQVRRLLWGEISKIHGRADKRLQDLSLPGLGGKLNVTSLEGGGKWYMEGFSTDKPDSFQGAHEENIFLIIDEASGVDRNIYDAAEGILTSENSFVLLIGNPTDPTSAFYDACQPGSGYHVITISAYDSPNVKHHKIIYPQLVSETWVKDKEEKWGIDSPMFQSRVLGEFPEEGENVLIPLKYALAALEKYNAMEENDEDVSAYELQCLTTDVARMGNDSTVVGARFDKPENANREVEKIYLTLDKQGKIKINETVDLVEFWLGQMPFEPPICVDDIGLGCLIKDTEVLTSDGWKFSQNISSDDQLYSRDDNGNVVLEQVIRNVKREKTRIIDVGDYAFSFSHWLPYRTRVKRPFKLSSWDNISSKKYFTLDTGFNWKGTSFNFELAKRTITMPYGGKRDYGINLKIKGKDFAKFLGWFLSEGCCWNTTVTINQSVKSVHNEQIRKILKKCFGKFAEKVSGNEISFEIYNIGLVEWLHENCYTGKKYTSHFKKTPDILQMASQGEIKAFLYEYMCGDGYLHHGKNEYVTSSKRLADDVLLLMFKIGKYGNIGIKQRAGSTSTIEGRILTRTQDVYYVYEWVDNAISCVPKNVKEYFDCVYDIHITGATKLFMCRFSNGRAFWVHNGGVTDYLEKAGHDVVPVNVSHSASMVEDFEDDERFENLRAKIYWLMRDDYVKGLVAINSEDLAAEVGKICYQIKPKTRKIQIEAKEEIKKRIGKSPDEADAQSLSYADYYQPNLRSLDK